MFVFFFDYWVHEDVGCEEHVFGVNVEHLVLGFDCDFVDGCVGIDVSVVD